MVQTMSILYMVCWYSKRMRVCNTIRWSVLSMLIASCWLRVLLDSSISLLIFLSSCIVGTVVLRSPAVIVDAILSTYLFSPHFFHIFFSSFGSYMFQVAMYSWWIYTSISTFF